MRLHPGVRSALASTPRGPIPAQRTAVGPDLRQPWRPPVRIIGLLELLARFRPAPLRLA